MKCPIISAGVAADPNIGAYSGTDCLKEECAWWDSNNERCSVLVMALRIENLSDTLDTIEKKMPHVGQFTK